MVRKKSKRLLFKYFSHIEFSLGLIYLLLIFCMDIFGIWNCITYWYFWLPLYILYQSLVVCLVKIYKDCIVIIYPFRFFWGKQTIYFSFIHKYKYISSIGTVSGIYKIWYKQNCKEKRCEFTAPISAKKNRLLINLFTLKK